VSRELDRARIRDFVVEAIKIWDGVYFDWDDLIYQGIQCVEKTRRIEFEETMQNIYSVIEKQEVEGMPLRRSGSCDCDGEGNDEENARLNERVAELEETVRELCGFCGNEAFDRAVAKAKRILSAGLTGQEGGMGG